MPHESVIKPLQIGPTAHHGQTQQPPAKDVVGGCGELWVGCGGCGELREVAERLREGCGKLREVAEGCGKLREVAEGCGKLQEVAGCHTYYTRITHVLHPDT
jgi:hypothetical protein